MWEETRRTWAHTLSHQQISTVAVNAQLRHLSTWRGETISLSLIIATFARSLFSYIYTYTYIIGVKWNLHIDPREYIYIYIDYCINAVVAPFIKSTFLNDPRLYFVVRSDFCTKLKLKYLATDAVTIWQATIMWSYTLKPYQPYSHCTDGSFSPSHISSTFKTSRHQQLSGNKKKKPYIRYSIFNTDREGKQYIFPDIYTVCMYMCVNICTYIYLYIYMHIIIYSTCINILYMYRHIDTQTHIYSTYAYICIYM